MCWEDNFKYFIVYSGNKKNNYIKYLEINYEINIFGLLGVNEMKVDKYVNNKVPLPLYNSKPEWDYQFNNYKMYFNGRAKLTSKKNFILVKNKKALKKRITFKILRIIYYNVVKLMKKPMP